MEEQHVFYEFDTDLSILQIKGLIESGELSGLIVGQLNDDKTRMEVSNGKLKVIFFESEYNLEDEIHEKTIMIRVNENSDASEIFAIIEDYFKVPVMLMGG